MKLSAAAAVVGLLATATVVACTNGGGLGSIGGGGGGTPSPLPSSIGIAIPTGKIGVENDPVWGTISGYTQQQTSQILAFPPGSTLTLQNLSNSTPHTLNVIAQTKGPPPVWPKSPSLSFYPSGNGVLGNGYASGTLNAGATVKVKLSKPGIYLIGCAYHYIQYAMRDVIEVSTSATPGPTASPGPGGYDKPAPRAHSVADLPQSQLVDQLGRRFTLASLRGKPLVVTFVSAHCTDACPLINAQFAAISRTLAHDRIDARLLTITLDPEHDSLRDMRDIATRFQADPRRWIVAGGSLANVHEAMREFGVVSRPGERGYREEHTTYVYVLDSSGALSRTLLASTTLADVVPGGLRDGNW